MSREWKSGDVALMPDGLRAVVDEDGNFVYGRRRYDNARPGSINARGARPLVVIDYEHAEQVERLWVVLRDGRALQSRDNLAAALREFATPTPAKPDEPQGLGAVVETATGYRWLHAYCDEGRKQWIDKDGRIANYDEIPAVRVLSEGVLS